MLIQKSKSRTFMSGGCCRSPASARLSKDCKGGTLSSFTSTSHIVFHTLLGCNDGFVCFEIAGDCIVASLGNESAR